eukprot:gene11253-biopygen7206
MNMFGFVCSPSRLCLFLQSALSVPPVGFVCSPMQEGADLSRQAGMLFEQQCYAQVLPTRDPHTSTRCDAMNGRWSDGA